MKTISLSLLLLHFLLHSAIASPLAPAFYIFGDSLSDSGNNNRLPTRAKANYKPYGVDFPSGTTGRFTNGKTVADFIAQNLGLPYVPPYMGLSDSQRSKTITGVNYASGSAGILPETGRTWGKNIPLDKQLELFQSTVQSDLPQNFKSPQELSDYLAKSIFLVYIGGNDYINNYLEPEDYTSSKQYSPQAFAQLLAQKLSQGLQRLYELGARKIVVFEVPLVGCIPNIVSKFEVIGICVEHVNQLVSLYNALLPNLLNQLQSQLRGSVFVRAGAFNFSLKMKQNSAKHELSSSDKKNGTDLVLPCCAVSNHEQCIPDQPPCNNRNLHIFFDSYHPTESLNAIMASLCFSDTPSACSPINIKELAQI